MSGLLLWTVRSLLRTDHSTVYSWSSLITTVVHIYNTKFVVNLTSHIG